VYLKLRSAVNEREYWNDLKTSLGNRIQRCVDIVFPEFTAVFKEWNCPRGLATLKMCPLPTELSVLTAQGIIDMWRQQGMRRAGGNRGLEKAAQLLTKARQSVGCQKSDQQVKRELVRLVEEYERMVSQIEVMEKEIEALLPEVPQQLMEPMQSIQGLSPLLIAVILANAGDLRRYAHGRQLLSLAGLNLAESTSGKRKGQIVISKRGRRQLRKYLYLAVMGLVSNNPDFKRWHTYNVEVKKMKKQRSIFKLIGKLTRIFVGMVQRGETYNARKAAAHLPQTA
jgi:transposase